MWFLRVDQTVERGIFLASDALAGIQNRIEGVA